MPVMEAAHAGIVAVGPHLEVAHNKFQEGYKVIEPYHPDEIVPIFVGFVLCFYGSAFCTMFAAAEAFRMCGYNRTTEAFNKLWGQYEMAAAASKKDDLVDADHDGIADVKQLSAEGLFQRKLALAIKTCDPDTVSDGLQGIYAGALAIIATLQLRFAQVLTIGSSLGDGIYKTVQQVEKPIQEAVSPEHRKWIPQMVKYACKAFACTLAWFLQRLLFAFTSAQKGAAMLLRNGSSLLVRMGKLDPEMVAEGSSTFNYVEMVVGALGLYWQWQNGFGLGWVMGTLLFPISCVEYTLSIVIGHAIF